MGSFLHRQPEGAAVKGENHFREELPAPSRTVEIPRGFFPSTLGRIAAALHEVALGEVVAVRTQDP